MFNCSYPIMFAISRMTYEPLKEWHFGEKLLRNSDMNDHSTVFSWNINEINLYFRYTSTYARIIHGKGIRIEPFTKPSFSEEWITKKNLHELLFYLFRIDKELWHQNQILFKYFYCASFDSNSLFQKEVTDTERWFLKVLSVSKDLIILLLMLCEPCISTSHNQCKKRK